MKQFQERLLNLYNQTIAELEEIETEHKQFLSQAEQNNNVPENILLERMALARDNHRRLLVAKAEKELIESYNFE